MSKPLTDAAEMGTVVLSECFGFESFTQLWPGEDRNLGVADRGKGTLWSSPAIWGAG